MSADFCITQLSYMVKKLFSDSLNLTPPAPLYLRTSWRYTNAVIIIIIRYIRYSERTPLYVRWAPTPHCQHVCFRHDNIHTFVHSWWRPL